MEVLTKEAIYKNAVFRRPDRLKKNSLIQIICHTAKRPQNWKEPPGWILTHVKTTGNGINLLPVCSQTGFLSSLHLLNSSDLVIPPPHPRSLFP